MAYVPLTLPARLPQDVESLVRDRLEPFLVDVHTMMRMPLDSDPGLQGGCNFSTAIVLLSVVAGVSATPALFQPRKPEHPGDAFRELMRNHYPWRAEQGIRHAKIGTAAADDLYYIYRNPLAHALGVLEATSNPTGRTVKVVKGPHLEEELERLERAYSRPSDWDFPTVASRNGELHLRLRALYWGVRRMIQDLATARSTHQNTSAGASAVEISATGSVITSKST